ncbi:S-layer homology domain-containing protein [Paenibacillus sp. 1P07SE]|uniref:S-layer homology domain-containing protein n=1 Tax=Paenibacillus sp. 1P07SE TaxID=3132209 RepID=UPI0039A5D9F7
MLFEEEVTITSTVTPPPWSGGGGFPVTPGPVDPGTPVDVPGTVDAAIDEVREILAGLEGASPTERAELIAKAIDAAVVAIEKISSYNGASDVTVADGVATANIPDAGLLAIIAGISEIKSTLESLAPGSTADLKPRVVIVNLGAVEQDQVSVTISQAVFAAARAAGVAGFEIVADRLSVTVPASNTFSGGAVNLSVERQSPSEEPALTGVRTASSVYSFDLTVGGNTVTTFDLPVTLKVPVANTDGLDEELLSLAKIVNGSLESHGGFLRGQHIVEPRDSFSSYVIVENRVSFNDIGSVSAWAGRQIQVMAAKGAIQGRAAGQFVPRDNITRAEFAKMLVRAMNLENSSATENFADVNAGDWFAPYVAAAADLGIINGRSATSFAPNALITRAEMATMLARTLKITHELEDVADVEGSLAAFIDAGSIHATLRSGVALAASKELIIGYQGNFLPNDNANRAEAAVMVYRAFNFTE